MPQTVERFGSLPPLAVARVEATRRHTMSPATTLHELATAPDKRAYLQALLKQIVGSKQRKEATLKAGGVEQ